MIKINDKEEIVVEYGENSFCLKSSDEYKKLVILITDPKVELDASLFAIDENIEDERLKQICSKYKEFYEEFLKSKAAIITEAKAKVNEIANKDIN